MLDLAIYNSLSMLEPILHISCTTVGFGLGYLVHRYEETAEERTEKLLARYRHAPREWAEMIKKEGERQMDVFLQPQMEIMSTNF